MRGPIRRRSLYPHCRVDFIGVSVDSAVALIDLCARVATQWKNFLHVLDWNNYRAAALPSVHQLEAFAPRKSPEPATIQRSGS